MNPHHYPLSRRIAPAAAACLLMGTLARAQSPELQKDWDAQRAQAQAAAKAASAALAQQRAARKADPMAWVRTLDPLSAGGWEFRAVAPDGSWAAFSTDHQYKRSGHVVTAWIRQEYAESQHDAGGNSYLSNVEKVQYDCAKELAKGLQVIYYADNNLSGGQQTEDSDAKQTPWSSIVPGTQTESLYDWACRTAAGKPR